MSTDKSPPQPPKVAAAGAPDDRSSPRPKRRPRLLQKAKEVLRNAAPFPADE